MSQLILSRGVEYRKNFLKKFFPNMELGPSFLIASLVLFVGLVTIITLMFSARQVTKGYVLNSLESQHQEIIKESERLDMEISEVRSLNFIQDSQKVKSMKKPVQVTYYNGVTTIAKR